MPAAGAGIFLLYLRHAYGDALITVNAQQGWARIRAWPWTTFRMAFEQLDLGWLRVLAQSPNWATLTSKPVRFGFGEYETLDVVVTLLAIPLLGCNQAADRIRSVCVAAVRAAALQPLDHPSVDVDAALRAGALPVDHLSRELLRRPVVFATWMTVSVVMLALLTIQFSTWFWVA